MGKLYIELVQQYSLPFMIYNSILCINQLDINYRGTLIMNAKTFEKLFDYISYNSFYEYSQTEMLTAEEFLKNKNGAGYQVTEAEAWIWLEERRRMKFQKLFTILNWDAGNVRLFMDLLIYNKDDFKRKE